MQLLCVGASREPIMFLSAGYRYLRGSRASRVRPLLCSVFMLLPGALLACCVSPAQFAAVRHGAGARASWLHHHHPRCPSFLLDVVCDAFACRAGPLSKGPCVPCSSLTQHLIFDVGPFTLFGAVRLCEELSSRGHAGRQADGHLREIIYATVWSVVGRTLWWRVGPPTRHQGGQLSIVGSAHAR